jgi:hypothetical protein
MLTAWGNQGAAWNDAVAVFGFQNFNVAQAVEAGGKCASKFFWHVLDDDDAWSNSGQLGQNALQCLGAACGCADRKSVV